jgi:hypothetical protein
MSLRQDSLSYLFALASFVEAFDFRLKFASKSFHNCTDLGQEIFIFWI